MYRLGAYPSTVRSRAVNYLHHSRLRSYASPQTCLYKRRYHVLAIESSCDDSAVCLIQKDDNQVKLLDHRVRSLDTTKAGGIVPSDALVHHLRNIAPLVHELLEANHLSKVDLVCATRGPGMYASLASGLNVAKGLAVAWNVPFIGVHHMLGHLLTPRFFSNGQTPQYPFLSLLASGGHTMLVLSKSTTDHEILANTVDIAIGDSLDKCAREIGLRGKVLGKCLEEAAAGYTNNHEEYEFLAEQLKDIRMPKPLQNSPRRANEVAFSFAGFITAVKAILANSRVISAQQKHPEICRLILADKIQRGLFEHVVSKVKLSCDTNEHLDLRNTDFVLAGGVASNMFVRKLLQKHLAQYNFNFHFMEPKWCTDNALMIGWAGIELWEQAHLHTDVATMPIARWPLAEILAVDDWKPRSE